MNRKSFVIMLLLAIALIDCASAQAQAPQSLHRVKTIPLPGVEGRIDHMDIDLKTQRVFVAALGNNTVEVVSLEKGTRLKTLKGFEEPQGVLFMPESNRLFVTNGGKGNCEILDATSFSRLMTTDKLDDADNSLSPGRNFITDMHFFESADFQRIVLKLDG